MAKGELADAKTGKVVDTIRTTRDHPFYVTTKGWVAARYLGIGTSIVTRAGPALVVKSLKRVAHLRGVKVYNFKVEQEREDQRVGIEGGASHSYFAGAASAGVWVHNGKYSESLYCCPPASSNGGVYLRCSPITGVRGQGQDEGERLYLTEIALTLIQSKLLKYYRDDLPEDWSIDIFCQGTNELDIKWRAR